MRYDISKHTAPVMSTLGKGTECIKIPLSQASKDMHEPLAPVFFPVLGAHISGVEFQYPDHSDYYLKLEVRVEREISPVLIVQ